MKLRGTGVLLALLVVWTVALPAQAQSVDDLDLITENYPPLNFALDGKVQGIAADLLVEMLKLAGAHKTRENIQVMPWARGLDNVTRNKNTLLFAATRTEARDKLYKWVGPIMPSKIVLVAKKSRAIKIPSIQRLLESDYRIGVVRDDVGAQLLAREGFPTARTDQVSTGQIMARMLAADRVDLWAYGEEIIWWNMRELGIPANDYEEVFTLAESEQYFMLNKDTSDEIVQALQGALNKLKASGRLKEIQRKYR